VSGTTSKAGAAAEVAASSMEAKYADIDSCYIFQPIAVETLGVSNTSACLLLNEIDKRISVNTGESRQRDRISVPVWLSVGATVQCYSVA